MENFEFFLPTKVHFGKKQITVLSKELKRHAKRLLIVSGRGSIRKYGIWKDVVAQVKKAKIPFWELTGVYPNPHLDDVYEGIRICREQKIDFILAVGGGSVIDSAKAIGAGVKYPGDVWDFFTRRAVVQDSLPVATVLTLAAAGSEMNGNMVISKVDTAQKLALGTQVLRPVFSILDPTYTYSVNAYHTGCGVVDIMVHIFEQYFSPDKHATIQDRIAESLMRVCIEFGPLALKRPRNYDARAQIMWASSLALCGLIGQGKRCDWATHYMEHELSALYDVAHGAGLAVLSPVWMEYVLGEKTLDTFIQYAREVWNIEVKGSRLKIAKKAIHETRTFFSSLGMPHRLRDIGVRKDELDEMIEKACRHWGGSLGSFVTLKKKDVREIFYSAF